MRFYANPTNSDKTRLPFSFIRYDNCIWISRLSIFKKLRLNDFSYGYYVPSIDRLPKANTHWWHLRKKFNTKYTMWLIGVNYILKNYQINISAIHWGVVPLTSSIAGYLAFSVKLSAIKKRCREGIWYWYWRCFQIIWSVLIHMGKVPDRSTRASKFTA